MCVICGILALIESIRECKDFVVTHYDIESPKLNVGTKDEQNTQSHTKMVVLSDLHNKEYGENNRKLLQKIREIKPDIIVIAGDMLVGKEEEPVDVALHFMKALAEIAPIYYGNGNHEQRMRDFPERYGLKYQEYKQELVSNGIVFLENTSEKVLFGTKEVAITGFELPPKFYGKNCINELCVEEIVEQVGESSDQYQILIAHHPTYGNEYVEWGADLVLSGHLHGGIIRIPLLGALITPQFQFFPKYSGGHYKYKGSDIVVSKGIGEHTVKIRFFNKPEVIVLDIKGKSVYN